MLFSVSCLAFMSYTHVYNPECIHKQVEEEEGDQGEDEEDEEDDEEGEEEWLRMRKRRVRRRRRGRRGVIGGETAAFRNTHKEKAFILSPKLRLGTAHSRGEGGQRGSLGVSMFATVISAPI